jgi:hypothetical protein
VGDGMEAISRSFEKLVLEVYAEIVFDLKLKQHFQSRDIQNLINKTVLVDNVNELYRILHSLQENSSVGGHNDAFACWVLYQNVAFLVSVRFDFLQLIEREQPMPYPSVSKIYEAYFEHFMLGQLNELIEDNLKSMSRFYRKKGFNKVLKRIERDTKRSYFALDFNKKVILARHIFDYQIKYYEHVNKAIKNLSAFEVDDLFEYNWNESDLKKLYVDMIMYSQKIEIAISLLNKTKSLILEEE